MPKSILDQLSTHAREQLLELEREKLRRDISPLKLYVPYDYQKPFHYDKDARESLVIGGNRCLSGDTMIYDPVLGCERRLDEIDSAFHVLSWDGEGVCVKSATKPFIKGEGEIYEITLSNGEKVKTTLHHRVLTTSGWKSVSDALHLGLPLYRQESIEGTALLVSRQGVAHSTQTTPDCLDGCSPDRHQCDGQLQSSQGVFVYITSVRLLGKQNIWDITVADTSCYWLGGVLHHNSGKTASCAMEFAWAVTGTHPVKGKYPSENANAMVVAQNWNHIGRVIYNYLFRAGAFKIIKDLDTGIWRAFDFVKDADRKDEAKPAPPLIPERMIKKKAWVLKASNMISYVELENGWNIWFFSSDSDPPQGHAASLVWVDEDLNGSENWIAELQARLADRQGRLIWSAMPHSRNDALLGLAERAEKAEEAGKTHIKKYTFRFLDNPAIAQEEKALMLERWAGVGGEAEIRRRAEGDFVLDQQLVYPTFNLSLHTFEGEVGSDWTRYMVVDPGHAIAAVLFGAVPPTNDQIVIYDELYIRGCSATVLAEEVFKKVSGQQFWAFIVDAHGSRLTDIGSGRSPQQQYSEAFAERGIESTVTGSSFIPGCDDIASGIQAVRECLYVRGNGNSRLKVVRSAVPHFLKEIKKYRFKMQKSGGMNIVTDVPNNKADNHLMDCLRYLCTYDPQFHRQEKQEEKPWWFEWKARRDKNKSPAAVMLTPESYSFTFEA